MQCPQCGYGFPDGAKFCPHCGASLGGKKKKPGINGAVIAIFVLAAIVLACFAAFQFELLPFDVFYHVTADKALALYEDFMDNAEYDTSICYLTDTSYGYCDIDNDGRSELIIRGTDARNYGQIYVYRIRKRHVARCGYFDYSAGGVYSDMFYSDELDAIATYYRTSSDFSYQFYSMNIDKNLEEDICIGWYTNKEMAEGGGYIYYAYILETDGTGVDITIEKFREFDEEVVLLEFTEFEAEYNRTLSKKQLSRIKSDLKIPDNIKVTSYTVSDIWYRTSTDSWLTCVTLYNDDTMIGTASVNPETYELISEIVYYDEAISITEAIETEAIELTTQITNESEGITEEYDVAGIAMEIERGYSGASAIITGYDKEENAVWEYQTEFYSTEESWLAISEIGWYAGKYFFAAGDSIIALNAYTGELIWENNDYGGNGGCGPCYFAEDALYVCGHDQPDFFAVSYDGETIYRIEEIDEYTFLPYEMEKQEDGSIWIYYSSGPVSSSTEFICSVDPQTWEYKRIS